MRLKRNIYFLLILSFTLLFTTGCKPKSIDTAIEKLIPYDVNNVIKKVEIKNDLVLVFYILKTEIEQGNDIIQLDDVLNIAIFKGDSETGWEFLGEKGWSNYNHPDMEVYDAVIFYKDGQEDKNIAVTYGRVYNLDIVEIEVGNEETFYSKANLFKEDGIRYFYKIYNISDLSWKQNGKLREGEERSIGTKGFEARGISKDGKIISKQKGQ